MSGVLRKVAVMVLFVLSIVLMLDAAVFGSWRQTAIAVIAMLRGLILTRL